MIQKMLYYVVAKNGQYQYPTHAEIIQRIYYGLIGMLRVVSKLLTPEIQTIQ